jgi:CDP-diacylglycerol--serine O-phosphatidyltransferase
VALDDPDKPAWAAGFFAGAPAPAGAGLSMLPMYLGFLGLVDDGRQYALIFGPYVVAVALLMVSRVPTYSGKNLGRWIPRELVLPILGLGAFTIIMLAAYPWELLTVLAVAYVAMIPLSVRSYRRHRKAAAEATAEKA